MAEQEQPVASGTFKVTMENGDVHEVRPKLGELVRFERKYGQSAARLQELSESGEAKAEWLVFLAWSALCRKKLYDGDFDQFLDDMDDVNVMTEDDEKKASAGEGQAASARG